MEDFLSSCSDAGIETEKTLAQVKEKWRSLFDKYKAIKDNNNKTGRDRRTFEFYDEIRWVHVRVRQSKPEICQGNASNASEAKGFPDEFWQWEQWRVSYTVVIAAVGENQMRKMIHPADQKRKRREQASKERRQKVPFSISWRHNKQPSRKQTRKTNGCSRLC